MLTTKRYRKRYGGNICRRCINNDLGIHLRPYHCIYEAENKQCPCCRVYDRHIVSGFQASGKLKVLFK